MKTHYPHWADPKNKPTIIRYWTERRFTKCPIKNSNVVEKEYEGTFVEYTYIDKKKRTIHVPEAPVLIKWIKNDS